MKKKELSGDTIGDLEADVDILLGAQIPDDQRALAVEVRDQIVQLGETGTRLPLEMTMDYRNRILGIADMGEAYLYDDIAERMNARPHSEYAVFPDEPVFTQEDENMEIFGTPDPGKQDRRY